MWSRSFTNSPNSARQWAQNQSDESFTCTTSGVTVCPVLLRSQYLWFHAFPFLMKAISTLTLCFWGSGSTKRMLPDIVPVSVSVAVLLVCACVRSATQRALQKTKRDEGQRL